MTVLAKIIEQSRAHKEMWRYTDVKKLLAKASPSPTAVAIDVAQSANSFVFLNGVYQPEKSRYADALRDALQGDAENGYRLIVAGQVCLAAEPLELVFLNDNTQDETPCSITIELGANSRLNVLERHLGVAHAACPQIDVVLGAQAKLVHGRILQQQGGILSRLNATLADGAYYDNFTLLMGNALTRNDLDVALKGCEAQVALNGVMLLDDTQHGDTRICVNHNAPNGISRQFYKILAAGKSQGVFQGKVVVAKGAQKTHSQQLCRSLLLSDQAEIDAKPELEIYADDVACSHGSTVGDLDAEALFYLRARGVPEQQAHALLMRAFAEEVLQEIQIPAWRELCEGVLERWFHDRGQ